MKRIFIILFIAALTLFMTGLIVITSTETGLQWVVSLAQKAVPEMLSVSSVNGRITGPLRLNRLVYAAEGLTITVDDAAFDWKPSRLLLLQLHVIDLNVSGVQIETGTTETPVQEKEETEGFPEISLPVDIRIDNLLVSDLSIKQQDSTDPFVIQTVALKAQMKKEDLEIGSFRIALPYVSLAIKGDVSLKESYPLHIMTDWNVHPEGLTAFEGTGSLSGDMERLTVEQSVNAPFHALLEATVHELIQEPRWVMELSLDNLSLNSMNSAWPGITADASISSEGSVSEFDMNGTLDISDKQYGTAHAAFSAGKDHDTWRAKQISLTVPGTDAEIALSGTYRDNKKSATLDSDLTWNAVSWPLHGKDPLVTSRKGAFNIKGTPDNYEIALITDVTGQKIPEGIVELHGRGTMSSLNIQSLKAELLDGVLIASGAVKWDPYISWNSTLDMKSINPGRQWPEWQGNLNGHITADGTIQKDIPSIDLKSANITGTLRGHPIKADAVFSMQNRIYDLTRLSIVSGSATLHAAGTYTDVWDMQWDISVPELAEVVPEGKGQINGKGSVHGDIALPKIIADINGKDMSYESFQAGSLSLHMDVDAKGDVQSIIDVHAADIMVDTQEIKTLRFKVDGTPLSHAVSLSAETAHESVNISADAGYDNETWEGSLVQAALVLNDFGSWQLKQGGVIMLSQSSAELENLCWVLDTASLCIDAFRKERDVNGSIHLSEVPLSLLKPVMPPAVHLDGTLGGNIDMSFSNNELLGTASITLPSGSVTYSRNEEDTVSLPVERANLDSVLNKDGMDVGFEMSFAGRGQVSSSVRLPGFSPLEMHMEKQQVSARIHADLSVFDILPLFTPAVEKPAGVLSSDLNITGALSRPDITGYINIDKGEAGLPDLGLQITDARLHLSSDSSGSVDINGMFSSGQGKAQITGQVALKDIEEIKADMRIKGEKIEAVNIPQVWVVVSPDISMKLENRTIHVEGMVDVPEALIEPPDLSNAASVSKDVVIISEESPDGEKNRQFNIHSRVKLTLGDNVRFKGFGLSGRITGGMDITEEPGKATRAQGEMQVLDGQYKAYGQELTIEKGRLLFVGLVDDPGLDIRAMRKIQEVSAGVKVTGTLKTPELNIYSVPAMDQSDALSYLLFGRPMNRLSNSEGGKLHNAAYVSGAGLLAKKIGTKFGVSDIEVEKGETQQESTLVLGRYLSPKLYVSYGIGLFEPVNTIRMRYTLSPVWQLQTEYGIESGGDILYTIER